METCPAPNLGGFAVHTTELELTHRVATADHGNCAVYRISDPEDATHG